MTYLLLCISKIRSNSLVFFTLLSKFCFGILILTSLFITARLLSEVYQLRIPPAIIGIIVLFLFFLIMQCIPRSIALAGKSLLNHMSIFFIPALVGIVNYLDLIKAFPLALFLAVVVTTLISLAITAWLAQYLMSALHAELSQPTSQSKQID